VNYRQVDNLRESDAQNFFQGVTNVYWLNDSGISNTGSSLDPAAFGYRPCSGFSASYDFAMAALVGLVPRLMPTTNSIKNLNRIPQGQLVPRHFRDHEYEFYGQDQWRIKTEFHVHYGCVFDSAAPL